MRQRGLPPHACLAARAAATGCHGSASSPTRRSTVPMEAWGRCARESRYPAAAIAAGCRRSSMRLRRRLLTRRRRAARGLARRLVFAEARAERLRPAGKQDRRLRGNVLHRPRARTRSPARRRPRDRPRSRADAFPVADVTPSSPRSFGLRVIAFLLHPRRCRKFAAEIAAALGLGAGSIGLVLPYSRRHELEADAATVTGADGGEPGSSIPAGRASTLWRRIGSRQERRAAARIFLSDPPGTAGDRIEACSRQMPWAIGNHYEAVKPVEPDPGPVDVGDELDRRRLGP